MEGKKEGKAQFSDLGDQSLNLKKEMTSSNLSKTLALELMGLIKQVNKNEVTPETVNASCNCASQIYKILKMQYEMKKEGIL